MKLISKDLKKGTVKVGINNLDDLWYLSQVIDPNDLVSGSTERKIKIGQDSDRNIKVVRKKVFLELKVEKIELKETLRVLGTITNGPDDVSFGSHHSFDLGENDVITITKETWFKFQLDKIKEATEEKRSNILIIAFDREEAYFALLRKIGVEHLTHISGEVQKKDDNNITKSNFYTLLIKTTEEYDKKYNFSKIIAASPAFWKEELAKNLNNSNIKQKFVFATCSSVGKGSFNEVLKRPEVLQALHDDRISKELSLVDDLLSEVSKENAKYGFKEVETIVNVGAVKHLLVTTKLIKDLREKNDYEKLDTVMKTADSMKADITIIGDNDGGKKLDGIGGIGAMLRYKV